MKAKNLQEIAIMRKSGKILAEVLKKTKQFIKPDVSTIEIDDFVEKLITSYGAKPSFKGFRGYKHSSCVSINEEIVHGIPGKRKIKIGDLVSLDIGINYQEYHADAAISFIVGKSDPDALKLVKTTEKSLEEAIKLVKHGKKIGDIQERIQQTVEKENYSIIRDLAGHGIGRELQEEPIIFNYGKKGQGFTLKEGMTICIEPMVAKGHYKTKTKADGWTVVTADHSLSAHFEHTILVTRYGSEVLTNMSNG